MSNQARNITLNTTKKLYALSGNRCANPDCHRELFKNGVQLGEIAHIKAASPNGPRYDASMTDDERRDYANLILLCGDCNKIIDGNPQKYPVELLYDWKRNHESCYQGQYGEEQKKYLERINNCQLRDVGVENDFFFNIKLLFGNNGELCKKHVLSEYILKQIEQCNWKDFKNLFVKGIAGIGKSTEMKYAYNSLIEVFSDKNNHQKYQFSPYPVYFELKNFQDDLPLPLDIENTIVFLDGFDELSEKNAVKVQKKIESIKSSRQNIRFIISGRDASFYQEFVKVLNSEVLKLSYEINLNDECDQKLYYHYLNTPLFSLIFIPFYKYRALQDKYKDIKNLKQFIETIINDKLNDDKKRKDYADGISSRQNSLSKIDFENLKISISIFVFYLYSKGSRYFKEAEVLDIFKNDDFSECFLKSSLIEEHESKLSFVSNIYYEYFLALYFSTQKLSVIRNNLFLSNGKAKVQEIVVISMLLNILDNESSLYKKITKQLSEQSSTYILLTDYITLSSETRFDFYKKILNEYNERKAHIYYLRFRPSHNLLANTESLSDCLIDLLPDEFKLEAINLHKKQIDIFLENPQKLNLNNFANSIILLGLHNRKIWNEKQQDVLKSLTIPTIQFFLNNTLAKELDGLLSFEIILYWYLEYGWTDCFSESDWRSFLTNFIPNTPDNFYTIGNETDFKVKLVIFNLFHKNQVVSKLFKALSIRILDTEFDNGSAGTVPSIIDDNYEGHLIHVDRNITRFGDCLNEINVLCEEILNVFNNSTIENSVYKIHSTERDVVLDGLWKLLDTCANYFRAEHSSDLLYFIRRYLDDGHFMFQDRVNYFCKNLNADAKIELLYEILKDKCFFIGEKNWYHCAAIIELLDNGNIDTSKKILGELKQIFADNHRLIVRNIASKKEKHLLKEYCNEILPSIDPVFIEEDSKLIKTIEKFEHDKQEMLAKETSIICNKNELLKEINRVSKYVEENISNEDNKGAWNVLYEMELQSIEHSIRWPYKKNCTREVFSAFVVNFLKQRKFLKDDLIDLNAVYKEVEVCFASETVFWRYIYVYCISNKKTEDIKQFLSNNQDIVERIKKSMQTEVTEIVKQLSGEFFDKKNCNYWMYPFLYYSALLYKAKLPDWFDENKITDFIICADIYHELHYHRKDIFSYDSIFEWLEIECGVAKSMLIESSIKCYEEVNVDSIRSRIIYFLSEVDDCNVIDFVVKHTKKVLDENTNQHEIQYAFAHYWRTIKLNKTDEIVSFVPFEKFLSKTEESSTDLINAMVDYFCENASIEQKKKTIRKVSTLEGIRKQELLRNLGDERAISCAVDEYLNGANVNSNLDRSLFEIKILDDRLYEKFVDLYEYTIEKSTERRRILGNWSLYIIKENISKKRFDVLRKRLERVIEIRRENGDYWEWLQDILDEIEQKLYENILEEDENQIVKKGTCSISSLCAKRIYISCILLPVIILIVCIPMFGWDKIEPITYIVGSIELLASGVLSFIDGKFKSPFQRIEEYFE